MFQLMTKPKAILITVIILSSFLTVSAAGSFFYRNAVLGFETQKNLLMNLNLSYTYLLSSLQEHSTNYIVGNDSSGKKEFISLSKAYTDDALICLNFEPISKLQASNWISYDFSDGKSLIPTLTNHLGFEGEEQTNYALFSKAFNRIVSHLSAAVENKDPTAFLNQAYINDCNSINFYTIGFTSAYLSRTNLLEDQALHFQNVFVTLSFILSVALAAVGGGVAYSTILTNRNNYYYRKLFASTVETADFGLAILDSDCQFKYMNAHYKEILNIEELNPIGKTPYALMPTVFNDSVSIPSCCEDGLTNFTITLPIKDQNKHINVSKFAIQDERGLINFVCIIRDITDLTNMEMQLKEQLSEIEFHSKAKDTFLANISHEIKTPLNAIIGLSYMLNDTELSTSQRGIVTRITSASNLLLSLINDILDLSKIKSADFNLYPTDVLLANLLSEIEGIATALIGGKNVLWKTAYNFNPALCIHIDKTRLTQILLNLINNACKFTNEGALTLSVETLEEDSTSAVLKFSVKDTGLGMNAQDLEKLFHEFEQLENHLTKQHQGTGLGLTICKNIIETMGGEIWVKSKKDEGSEFSFTIPVDKTSPETIKATLNLDAVPVLDGNGKRVLIVEDNEINYEVTASILSKSNILCENASDGEIAIAKCKNVPEGYYQLILMDIHMPKMDGYTASKILRDELKITTPIIALTATNVDAQTLTEYKGIFDGYIPKPFNYYDLLLKISPYFSDAPGFTIERRKNLAARMEGPFSGRAKAIENLGGMADLYEKHLSKFKVNYATFPVELELLLSSGNIEEARRLVHSVKGLAGTLGLPYLQMVSASLEDALLTDKRDLIDSLFLEFKQKLEEVCYN